ncbi:MAG: helix-turn-helix transcriptional regulator [Candidatus Geothermarchaeales archaeon]
MRLVEARSYRALSNESRLRILRILYRGARSIEEISGDTGLRPVSVRHHLLQLGQAGLVSTFESRTGNVGRPKTYYDITRDSSAMSYPKRNYLKFSKILLRSMLERLGERKARSELRKAAKEIGREIVRGLSAEHFIDGWTLQHFVEVFVRKFLEEAGAEPDLIEADGDRVVFRIHNCLYYELALLMPEIICDEMDNTVYKEMCLAMSDQWRVRRSKCVARGDACCEYVVEA